MIDQMLSHISNELRITAYYIDKLIDKNEISHDELTELSLRTHNCEKAILNIANVAQGVKMTGFWPVEKKRESEMQDSED